MAYDEELAHRIRELLSDREDVTEMAMFGGLAFLLAGNMSVAASGQGGLLVRAGPRVAEGLLADAHVSPMMMRGREMKGWLRVEADALRGKRELARWVRRGVEFASTLPPKG